MWCVENCLLFGRCEKEVGFRGWDGFVELRSCGCDRIVFWWLLWGEMVCCCGDGLGEMEWVVEC